MAWNYIRDGINPRGAEYGATARAARAAENTQRAMDDMLALAMAPDEDTRRQLAQQIYARKQIEARRARRSSKVEMILIALFVLFCIGIYQLGTDGSTISRAFNAYVAAPLSQAAAAAKRPARAVRAPDTNAFDLCVFYNIDANGKSTPAAPDEVESDGLTAGEIERDCRERPAHTKELKAEGLSESDAL